MPSVTAFQHSSTPATQARNKPTAALQNIASEREPLCGKPAFTTTLQTVLGEYILERIGPADHQHYHMVPGAGVVRHGKRKAEHERHTSSSKKAMEVYCGEAGAMTSRGGLRGGGGRSGDNSGEEATDDESEFSSVDGRTSPSQPGAWGAATAGEGARGHFNPAGPHGFAVAAAAGLNLGMEDSSAAGFTGASSCWSAFGGNGAGPQQQQQLLLEQQYCQQQQLVYQQQLQQQQLQQQQGDGRRMVRGGARLEGDEWGWFVDAGEQEQQGHPGQWGVRRSAQH